MHMHVKRQKAYVSLFTSQMRVHAEPMSLATEPARLLIVVSKAYVIPSLPSGHSIIN